MKKLGDLKAVREEFKRIKAIMSARAQALENAKKSALPAIDALQELVTCVERASVCMSDALAPSTISSESSSGDKKTCGHLNFVQLQGNASAIHVNSQCHSLCHSLVVVITDCLTLMFNYLTPFHMSASRRSGEFVYFSRSSYIYVCACVCVSLFELFVYVINISAYVLVVVCQQPLMTCAEYVPTSQCMTQKLWQKSVCNYRNTNLTGSARNQRQ
jgi:hypothetical protein